MEKLVTLDKRARTAQGVYVDVQDWADLRERGRKLQWWSAWTPLELQTAESVTIAGASYQHSILAKVTELSIQGRSRSRRFMSLVDCASPGGSSSTTSHEAHRGSSTFWKDKGRDCLVQVCRLSGAHTDWLLVRQRGCHRLLPWTAPWREGVSQG